MARGSVTRRALAKPYVKLSVHPASVIQPCGIKTLPVRKKRRVAPTIQAKCSGEAFGLCRKRSYFASAPGRAHLTKDYRTFDVNFLSREITATKSATKMYLFKHFVFVLPHSFCSILRKVSRLFPR